MSVSPLLKRFLLLGLSVAFALALAEISLRAAFALPALEPLALRMVRHIGNPHVDDEKQRLKLPLLVRGNAAPRAPPNFHPRLGLTARRRTAENPFGVEEEGPYLNDGRPRVLMFGDSFVEGFTDFDVKIPQILDQKLPDVRVLNFGVRGFGLDQMYLYSQWAIEELEPEHVLVGLLYADLDRLLFRINQGPKPYFELVDDEIVLRGVPIPPDVDRWLETYPPQLNSYALAAGRGVLRRLLVSRWATEQLFELHPSQTKQNREQKKLLTRRLIEKIRNQCREHGVGLTFVLFPHPYHLIHEGWEELFVRGLLDELGVDYVDMQAPLQVYVNENDLAWWKDVYTLRAHPNPRENRVMATSIHRHLCREFAHLDQSCKAL